MDDLVPEAEVLGEAKRQPAMTVGIARAVGGDAQRRGTEYLRRYPGEVGTVHAAAERDDQ